MPEKELMHWMMTVAIPLLVSLFTVFNVNKIRTETLERRLTKLEIFSDNQNKLLDNHEARLVKHEEEQKVMIGLIEQIRSLSQDIGELRTDLKDLQKHIGGK
ncbi:DUF7365 family protein [Streptococcus moroccensis]|uniref:Coiled-coil protein SlyX n=1 Tax=Streptococcus moroccensis TaxID=1451356 RepID=A0ABT9YRN6_9STRE|nr:hypothetical protein [Streptococcus moroccensis]MDQ0221973.1 putative coiled-coil protein SlyX [Streptococcus moroccensis]